MHLLVAACLTLSVASFEFSCVYESQDAGSLGVFYTCAPEITATESAILIGVTGEHLDVRTNGDVKFLFISGQSLEFIPRGINEFFANLLALTIGSSGLQTISSSDLQQFPGLLYLDLPHNRLVSLDGDLFRFTPNLLNLFLNGNQIEHIGHNLFDSLEALLQLNLSGNECTSGRATTRAEVLELAIQLMDSCPPLETTTSDDQPDDTTSKNSECSCTARKTTSLGTKARSCLSRKRVQKIIQIRKRN